ncbi:hypothetical protein EJ04DRAFT_582994 [Polyplosphaeria fusca]|uniref:Uncharacterized protein n=1 Tax=Polyplosphaeria fusca TaxID=682080 RepID=A0A9P4V690_9PLEO|nr:hypothetical protein EJ04DRAFT_582994 [Polyplosphaeria fusca]
MHKPPEPHYSFTIPSVHDDTTLDCRLYHPDVLSKAHTGNDDGGEPWSTRGIAIAHPYAPMGGSQDDRIVGIIVEEFLSKGYIVGTFNFRGAHGSRGRTSWSGKPELDDYTSFAAFFIHYLAFLRPSPSPDTLFTPSSPTSPTSAPSSSPSPSTPQPTLILSGYSYGSLILKHLPALPTLLHPFLTPLPGTSPSEILLRAHKLASQTNLDIINRARFHSHHQKHSVTTTLGGEETTPDLRRSSRETRRSLDVSGSLTRDFKGRMRSLSHRRRSGKAGSTSHPQTPPSPEDSGAIAQQAGICMPAVRYLLVSPLAPHVSAFVAPGLVSGMFFWGSKHAGGQQVEVVGKCVLLVVNGGQDSFGSGRRVREWVEKLGDKGRVEHVEVKEAGHFWVEQGVEGRLRGVLGEWAGRVGAGGG